ncbi:serine/threonine-protein kinase [Streptomyces sp. NPDC050448]|uniref:serine/threonine-protein kinase n=1 Tax=Streptomyces sp. NPDC050448 TaxID=3155404 RepID=UPI00342ABFAC
MEALRDVDPARIGAHALLARLGAGGMGQVYLGRSPGGRLVAVKVIRDEIIGHPEALARFRREAETVRAVRSAYTANLIDASLTAPPFWLATEYVAGPTLSHAVAERGGLPADTCRRLFAALAEGLASVHAYGVTHRDLKPQNVILGTQGPQLIDFGIAKGAMQTALTQDGSAPGTPGYTAPEVLLRNEVADAADVFALGATMAYAATGRAPYGTGDSTAVSFRVVHGEVDVDAVDPGLAELIRLCVARDPAARPTPAEIIRRCGVDSALIDDPVYAALTATSGDGAQAPGLPSTLGPGNPYAVDYVPTYVPPAPEQAPAARRRLPRWMLVASVGLAAGTLSVGGYLLLWDGNGGGTDGHKDIGAGGRTAGPAPQGGQTQAVQTPSAQPSKAPSASSAASSPASSDGAPDHIEPATVSRDLWTGTAPGLGNCNLPAEERSQYLVSSVVDADAPDAKSVTGKVKIHVMLKPYHAEKTPYYVSVGVKPPHDIDETTGRPFENVKDYNKSIGYTSKPVDLDAVKDQGGVYLTYPDDFATQLVDNNGVDRHFKAIPLANDPGDWTVVFYHVQGVREYANIYCTGFPVK